MENQDENPVAAVAAVAPVAATDENPATVTDDNAATDDNTATDDNAAPEMSLPEKQQKCRDFAKSTGYSLTVGANVRKYGGPPPDGSERPKNSEIFLGRLPPTLFEDELSPILEQFGPLWEVRILLNEKIEFGRGFAFATFYTPKIAQTVVRTLTNKPIPGHPGKTFSISLSKPHSLVVIRDLPKQKTRATLMKDFEGFFEGILGVNIWGVEGKPPLLLASLEFGSERAAAGALGQILAGEVQPYKYKMDAYYSTCDHNDNAHIVVLHARNMPEHATEDNLRDFFAHYPAFERARIINKFAFIHFRDHLSAEKALQEQYGANFLGRPLELAWARTKTFIPQPPPPLPVSRESEERLYAYAASAAHGPQRNSGHRGSGPPPQRAHPYRDGPPKGDRRRPDPPSRGPHRGPPPPGRYSPPPPFYSQPRADYRPPSQSYDGPPRRGTGYNSYNAGDQRLGARPGNDQGYGYDRNPQPPAPALAREYSEPARGQANYGYSQPPSSYGYENRSSAASYDYNPTAVVVPPQQPRYTENPWQSPVAPPPSTSSYRYNEPQQPALNYDYNPAPPAAPPAGYDYGRPDQQARQSAGKYGKPAARPGSQQSYRQQSHEPAPSREGDFRSRFSAQSSSRGKSNGASRNGSGYESGSGGGRPTYAAEQNGWEG